MKKTLWNTLIAIALTLCTIAFFSCEIIEIDLEGGTSKTLVENNNDQTKGEGN